MCGIKENRRQCQRCFSVLLACFSILASEAERLINKKYTLPFHAVSHVGWAVRIYHLSFWSTSLVPLCEARKISAPARCLSLIFFSPYLGRQLFRGWSGEVLRCVGSSARTASLPSPCHSRRWVGLGRFGRKTRKKMENMSSNDWTWGTLGMWKDVKDLSCKKMHIHAYSVYPTTFLGGSQVLMTASTRWGAQVRSDAHGDGQVQRGDGAWRGTRLPALANRSDSEKHLKILQASALGL